MSCVPDFILSSVIPEPAQQALENFLPLAILTLGDDMLSYYWWSSQSKVVVWAQHYNLWLQQNDAKIRDSLADVLGCVGLALETSNMMLFDGPRFHHGVQLPDKMAELFLDCEWSDYACDRRPVTGRLTIRFGGAHPSVASAVSPTNSNESSLSDDDAPPSPRRWRRWPHWRDYTR